MMAALKVALVATLLGFVGAAPRSWTQTLEGVDPVADRNSMYNTQMDTTVSPSDIHLDQAGPYMHGIMAAAPTPKNWGNGTVTQNYYKAGDVIPQDERHGGHAIYRVKQAGQWNGEDKPFDKFGKFVNVQFKGPTKDEKIDIVQKAEFVPREEYSDGGDQNRKCSKEDTMADSRALTTSETGCDDQSTLGKIKSCQAKRKSICTGLCDRKTNLACKWAVLVGKAGSSQDACQLCKTKDGPTIGTAGDPETLVYKRADFSADRVKWGGTLVQDCDCDGCDTQFTIANSTLYRNETGCKEACQDNINCKLSLFRYSYPNGTAAHHCYLYWKGAKKITQRCAGHPFTCFVKHEACMHNASCSLFDHSQGSTATTWHKKSAHCSDPEPYHVPGVETPAPIVPTTGAPSLVPSDTPTEPPTATPSTTPSEAPTKVPTNTPSDVPSEAPTVPPTEVPTTKPPSPSPSATPTEAPTLTPSDALTETPTRPPTVAPTEVPTPKPTVTPTEPPTPAPSPAPTLVPVPPTATPLEQCQNFPPDSTDMAPCSNYLSNFGDEVYNANCAQVCQNNLQNLVKSCNWQYFPAAHQVYFQAVLGNCSASIAAGN